MNDLVLIQDGNVFTNSMIIAIKTNYQHNSITRILRRFKKDFLQLGNIRFMDAVSKNSKGGRPPKNYLLNEPQATLLITYLENNEVVRKFKVELIKQFFKMRQILMQHQTQDWQETRRIGKLVRREETNMLQELVEHAKSQGSENCNMLYVVYSKLANQIVGITKRDSANVMQLNNLSLIENIIINCVREGITAHKHYKSIYKDCKDRLLQFKHIAYLN